MRFYRSKILLCLFLIMAIMLPALAEEALPELEVVAPSEEPEIEENYVLDIPAGLTEIADETFMGTACGAIYVPDSVLRIGDYAFADCSDLVFAHIPGSVEEIGEGILEGATADMLLQTDYGSLMQYYAMANSIDFQADTQYRALLIGNIYTDSKTLQLEGPANDVASLALCLESYDVTPYEVTSKVDATGQEIYDLIDSTFGDATDADVSLFYYSGHGALDSDGAAIIGCDMEYIYASDLRGALDNIPGRKIVLVDCCYSGGLLWRTARSVSSLMTATNATDDLDADDFTSAFMMPFTRKRRAANTLAGDSYFVITACAWDEESFEARYSGIYRGCFTYELTRGLGYQNKSGVMKMSLVKVDTDDNGSITIEEMSDWLTEQLIEEDDPEYTQSVQTWPDGCDWFGWLRW